MNWSAVRPTLLDVVRLIDGLDDDSAVAWADSSESAYHRKFPRVDISINSLVSYGEDEQRIEINEFGHRNEFISGPRRFTWNVRVETSKADYGEAMAIADRIRTRLNRRDAYALLLDAGLAVADYTPVQVVSVKGDARSYSIATFDVFVNCAENDQDESDYAGETIEQASIASEYIADPDGGNNPNQVQLEVSEDGY